MLWQREILLVWEAHGSPLSWKGWWEGEGRKTSWRKRKEGSDFQDEWDADRRNGAAFLMDVQETAQ